MFKKILKWFGIILLGLIAGIVTVTYFSQHKKYEAPIPDIKASTDPEVIAWGKHLVLGPAHCVDCHSTAKNVDSLIKLGQEPVLSGGKVFDLPFGKFYTRNLTPDKETGIGNYTDGEIARVLRYSIKKNGESVLPFMPFQNMNDEDLVAVISYLRSTKPVSNPVPQHDYNAMGYLIKAFLIKPVGPTERTQVGMVHDSSAEYGKHLVMAVANCNECHTKRNGIGDFVGEPLAGGTEFEDDKGGKIYSPNLTPDPSSRIFGWSQQAFINRFRMGRVLSYSHMPWESFGRMTDDELKAIYNYLQTVKPVKTAAVK